jgi:hypothetical protein
MPSKLKIGWHREHFLSPLLQLAERDAGSTFELVEGPGGTGEMQVKLREGEIDVCIGTSEGACMTDLSPYGRLDCWSCEWSDRVQASGTIHQESSTMVCQNEI